VRKTDAGVMMQELARYSPEVEGTGADFDGFAMLAKGGKRREASFDKRAVTSITRRPIRDSYRQLGDVQRSREELCRQLCILLRQLNYQACAGYDNLAEAYGR